MARKRRQSRAQRASAPAVVTRRAARSRARDAAQQFRHAPRSSQTNLARQTGVSKGTRSRVSTGTHYDKSVRGRLVRSAWRRRNVERLRVNLREHRARLRVLALIGASLRLKYPWVCQAGAGSSGIGPAGPLPAGGADAVRADRRVSVPPRTAAPPAPTLALRALGDVLGSGHYLGRCARCSEQFMSRHDRVLQTTHGRLCARCARSR
jgi:hypothetical protein